MYHHHVHMLSLLNFYFSLKNYEDLQYFPFKIYCQAVPLVTSANAVIISIGNRNGIFITIHTKPPISPQILQAAALALSQPLPQFPFFPYLKQYPFPFGHGSSSPKPKNYTATNLATSFLLALPNPVHDIIASKITATLSLGFSSNHQF